MDYVYSAQGLIKRKGGVNVLDGFSMYVPQGAIYGLVGRNGAGKTTLLRLLCGLQFPDGGAQVLFGCKGSAKGIELQRRKIGAVVETPAFYPDLSAEENLRYQYRLLGLTSFTDIPMLLQTVGLKDTEQKKARHFFTRYAAKAGHRHGAFWGAGVADS